jgi:hypothetical protein
MPLFLKKISSPTTLTRIPRNVMRHRPTEAPFVRGATTDTEAPLFEENFLANQINADTVDTEIFYRCLFSSASISARRSLSFSTILA